MVEHLPVKETVIGSSPIVGAICPHRQAVKSSPFQGEVAGSNPAGVTISECSVVGQHARFGSARSGVQVPLLRPYARCSKIGIAVGRAQKSQFESGHLAQVCRCSSVGRAAV